MSDDKGRRLKINDARKPFAKKSLGQNFLVDENYVRKIIDALDPRADEIIVEIGAGRGALTEKLLKKAGRVVAVEIDADLVPPLREKFSRHENFHLIQQDALKIDFREITATASLAGAKVKLVANLPYYISTAILQKLIEQRTVFSEMVLMFQREVVSRITAGAGNRERGFLTVLVEAHLTAEKLFDVPPRAFRPAPKIWSSVVRLITKNNVNDDLLNDKVFTRLVSCGFSQKRKTILNNLKNLSPEFSGANGDANGFLDVCGIDPRRRAETLTLDEWVLMTNFLSARG